MASRKPLVLGPATGCQEIATGDTLSAPSLALTTPLAIASGGTGAATAKAAVNNLLGLSGFYVTGFTAGNYVSVPSKAAFAFGTGDFTIEGWVNPATTSGNQYILDPRVAGSASSNCTVVIIASGNLNLYVGTNFIVSGAVTAGVWTHFAIVRASGTTKLYLNGTLASTGTDATSYVNAGPCFFGVSSNVASAFGGNLSNLRISTSALYTANFTTPTSAFAALATTVFLAFQNATFLDNSPTPASFTVVGAPSLVQATTPAGITSGAILTAAQGGTGDTGGAWTVSNPVPTASSGTFTSVSCTLRVKKIGFINFVNISIIVTTNGTAAGAVLLPLPFTAAATTVIAGREVQAAGKMLSGTINAGAASISIANYDNSYPASSGTTLSLSGVIESTT